MKNVYRVEVTETSKQVFYIEADSADDIDDFMQKHPEWKPHDEPGLVDEDYNDDSSYTVNEENSITADFALIDGDIVENEP